MELIKVKLLYKELLFDMFADAHCDTLSRILDKEQNLHENDGHVDIKRLMSQKCIMQIFAAWIKPIYDHTAALRCLDIIDNFDIEYMKNQDYIHIIKTRNDIDYALNNGKIGALLSIEGGSAVCGKLSVLRNFYRLGVRAMTLTWNGRNEIADGIGEGITGGGLSKFGKELVCKMNRLGMIIDVSHLSVKGFWDVAEICAGAFIASHSNAKALCGHRRNLDDDQIDMIIKRNGFIGINFCSEFLNENGADSSHIIRHIEYFLERGAQNVLGFGADFDGVDDLPNDIQGVHDMDKVINKLVKMGYNEQLINNILYDNLIRCTKEILKN